MFACVCICVVYSVSVLRMFMDVAQHLNRGMVGIYLQPDLVFKELVQVSLWPTCPVALAVSCPVLCLAQVA